MVPNFIKWCEDKSLPLPTVDENTKRAGTSQEYPDGYIRSQYCNLGDPEKSPGPAYFAPISATAYLDLKNAKKVKNKKDAGNTPL
jgi:hypothetical protein